LKTTLLKITVKAGPTIKGTIGQKTMVVIEKKIEIGIEIEILRDHRHVRSPSACLPACEIGIGTWIGTWIASENGNGTCP